MSMKMANKGKYVCKENFNLTSDLLSIPTQPQVGKEFPSDAPTLCLMSHTIRTGDNLIDQPIALLVHLGQSYDLLTRNT